MNVSGALEETLTALEGERRLTPAHSAHVAACRALAEALTDDPANASLWREYRAMLSALLELDRGADEDDERAFLVAVRTAVGHAKKPR